MSLTSVSASEVVIGDVADKFKQCQINHENAKLLCFSLFDWKSFLVEPCPPRFMLASLLAFSTDRTWISFGRHSLAFLGWKSTSLTLCISPHCYISSAYTPYILKMCYRSEYILKTMLRRSAYILKTTLHHGTYILQRMLHRSAYILKSKQIVPRIFRRRISWSGLLTLYRYHDRLIFALTNVNPIAFAFWYSRIIVIV